MLVHGPKLKIYLDLNCLVMFVDPLYILVSQSKMKEDKKIKDNTNKRTNKFVSKINYNKPVYFLSNPVSFVSKFLQQC